jgi:hypothetical protein
MCIATLFIQWRTTLHCVRVGEALGPSSLALQETLRILSLRYGATHEPEAAARMATATVNGLLLQQSSFMAALDYFVAIAAVAGLCLMAVLAERVFRYLRRTGASSA